MRIVFVVHHFPPYVGGIPVQAFRLSKGLSDRGHEVTVYTSTHPRATGSHRMGAIKVVRYDPLHGAIARFVKAPFNVMPGMFEMLKNEDVVKADIIQTFIYLSFVSFMAALLKFIRNKPFVITPSFLPFLYAREMKPTLQRKTNVKRRITGLLSESFLTSYDQTLGISILKYADIITAETSLEKRILTRSGVDPKRIRVVPGAINPEDYKQLPDSSFFRKKYALDSSDKLVLFVGIPGFWKGTHTVISAMQEVLTKVKAAKLVIVGPRVDKANAFLEQFGSLDVRKRTLVTGPLFGRDLISAYSSADALVLPSKGEAFNYVVLEALASGLPLIVTRIPPASYHIRHGKNGMFVKYGDVPSVSSAILSILMNKDFKKEAERNRFFILERYTSKRELDSYEKAYYDIISQKRNG